MQHCCVNHAEAIVGAMIAEAEEALAYDAEVLAERRANQGNVNAARESFFASEASVRTLREALDRLNGGLAA